MLRLFTIELNFKTIITVINSMTSRRSSAYTRHLRPNTHHQNDLPGF